MTLVTVLSTKDGSGAHSALIVNGAQRVIFDPAGSLSHASLAERGDVIYGANPAIVDSYIDYHTRNTHDTVAQTVDVTAAVAGRSSEARDGPRACETIILREKYQRDLAVHSGF